MRSIEADPGGPPGGPPSSRSSSESPIPDGPYCTAPSGIRYNLGYLPPNQQQAVIEQCHLPTWFQSVRPSDPRQPGTYTEVIMAGPVTISMPMDREKTPLNLKCNCQVYQDASNSAPPVCGHIFRVYDHLRKLVLGVPEAPTVVTPLRFATVYRSICQWWGQGPKDTTKYTKDFNRLLLPTRREQSHETDRNNRDVEMIIAVLANKLPRELKEEYEDQLDVPLWSQPDMGAVLANDDAAFTFYNLIRSDPTKRDSYLAQFGIEWYTLQLFDLIAKRVDTEFSTFEQKMDRRKDKDKAEMGYHVTAVRELIDIDFYSCLSDRQPLAKAMKTEIGLRLANILLTMCSYESDKAILANALISRFRYSRPGDDPTSNAGRRPFVFILDALSNFTPDLPDIDMITGKLREALEEVHENSMSDDFASALAAHINRLEGHEGTN
ncbi:hypothetical protein MMC25_004762 [Agyrium rufum]|nr:hypothetical protein [Agyrium rufum]